MPNTDNSTLARMALQALESLQAAGVQQLPTSTFTPAQTSAQIPTPTPPSASSLQRAGSPTPQSPAPAAHSTSTSPPGIGSPQARLCFLGIASKTNPSPLGDPFTGPAGELFNKILTACKLNREDVYLFNLSDQPEVAAAELQKIEAQFICCLGSAAALNLMSPKEKASELRGKVFDFQGKKVICTFHPAYLLTNTDFKKSAWEDMKMLLREMGTPLG